MTAAVASQRRRNIMQSPTAPYMYVAAQDGACRVPISMRFREKGNVLANKAGRHHFRHTPLVLVLQRLRKQTLVTGTAYPCTGILDWVSGARAIQCVQMRWRGSLAQGPDGCNDRIAR